MSEGKIYYRKLIRDKVPEKMAGLGVAFETRTLSPDEFKKALFKKVEEEASGIQNAQNREELVSEIADVLDVIVAIQELEGITNDELSAAQTKNMEKKGGFDTKTYLEWSADDGYTTNEKKGT